jgi:hypothetical protein
MKRTKHSFEADRGTVAVLNIKRKALIKMKSSNSPHPSMTDVYSNRCREPMNLSKGFTLQSEEEVGEHNRGYC